jgi:hypothetical protein
MTKAKEPTAAEVVQMLLDACKELLAECGRKRAADWEIINEGMVAGERFVRLSRESKREEDHGRSQAV